MALVERNEELLTLNRLFAECGRGRGQVALISGAVASGKTELVHTFTEHATGKGAIVLAATGSRAEHGLAFGVISQVFGGLSLPDVSPDVVATYLAALSGGADRDGGSIGQPRAVVLEGLCAALMAAARRKPVVIAVDDVHFADGASLQALLYLQRRTRFARVLFLLTEWALPRPARAVFRAEVTRQPNTTQLRLSALSRRGVEELIRARLDAATARTLAPVHHALSGGNPLLVTALIDDWTGHPPSITHQSGAAREEDMAVGQAYGLAVAACLHRWEPAMLEVARGLALLGDLGTPALIGKLLDMGADSVAHLLDVLESAGLLDGGRFRHPMARAAALDGLPAAERAMRHRRAAVLLHREGATATEVADHLIAGDTSADMPGSWAVGVLRHAAQEASAADRVDLAVARLDLAVRSCADGVERSDLLTQLLRLEWRANPAAARRHLPELVDARARGALSDDNAIHLAKFLLWYGDTEDLADTLADLAKGTHAVGGPVSLGVEWLSFLNPSATATSRDRGRSVLLDRIRVGQDCSVADTEVDAAVVAAGNILRDSRLGEQTLAAQLTALAALLHADQVDSAAAACTELLAESQRRRATTWQAVLGALLGELRLRQGDLPAAAELATVASDLLPPLGWGVGVGLPLAVRITAATAMGEHDKAADLLRCPVPEAMFHTQFGVLYLYSRGTHYLATGRPHAAMIEFQRCGELMTGWSLDLPTIVPWRVGLAQAQLALGDRVKAREIISAHLSLPEWHSARSRGVGLRVLASASDSRDRIALLGEAVDLLHDSGDRFELAQALAELSRAHDDAGDDEQAGSVARRARHLAGRCHAEPLSRELRVDRADPAPTPAPGSLSVDILSDAERRVAVLAALGHTNREIGGKLYITVSTVEQHLTRVYRKLKVRRRTDLPAGLPRQLLIAPDDR